MPRWEDVSVCVFVFVCVYVCVLLLCKCRYCSEVACSLEFECNAYQYTAEQQFIYSSQHERQKTPLKSCTMHLGTAVQKYSYFAFPP